ncbi:predicted protein [Histoplasma mississippiense (nom. inval.)]|nr:predicted protein [Histoplasma mississippiense (nom. inval.)]EDN08243.1 predicted protein [Histoplasma mississippiense (nom. inval.)]
MSSSFGSEFSNFDDDDILPVVNDATSADFSAASSDSSRAPKRRRLSHSRTSDKRDARTSWGTLSGTGHESGHESGQSQDTLPSLHRAPVARRKDEINTKPTGPKYKIYQSKHPRAQEPTFVTQLTQPPSSPSIIRGPRWKKPDPEDLAVKRAPTPVIDRSRNLPETNNNDMDGDLRVAIAASLESFRRENKGDMEPWPNPKERKSPVSSNSNFGPQDAFFDIGDIPEDAFDSSLDSSFDSPQKAPVLVPSSQPFPFQSSFRQQDAQIVFVAPTKPLVSQQVVACFGIAGIPRSQTVMLTGSTGPAIRAAEWQSKRVFFMTPQTLVNDLKNGHADPKRIVLLVIEEAHRATGGYAYVEVLRYERKESLDIREYVHSRNIEIETFDYSEDMIMCMDLFGKSLQPVLDKLRSQNAHWAKDPMTLTPYGLTVARKDWLKSPAGRNANNGLKGMVHAIFSVLSSLAHAIDLLKYHGIGPFYRNLVSFQSTLGAGGSKYQRQIVDDGNFKTLMNRLRMWTNNEDFIGHPKLEFLKRVVLNHFMDAEKDGDDSIGNRHPSGTRIMVFAHFRDSAEEIVRVLKRHGPMIRPHVFVGQAAAKGSGGMDQKTQLEIIEKFKEGTYNTIVATSVGEEGLDIGEVDLIVCYDSSASPIRMLQRMGRTGRKRRGNIVLLLMKGKEEDSFTKAKDNYEKMQRMIASGARFTFHDDKSPRILPRDIHPAVDERQIDIPVENSQTDLPEPTKRARVPKRLPKKFHMPDGVETGFTKASRISGMKVSRKATESLRKSPPKVVEVFDIPPLDEVLLSKDERRELEQRYCSIGGTSPQFVSRPRIDAYPELQRSYRPTKFVKHGAVTCRLVKAFQNMNALTTDCADHFKAHLHPDDQIEQYEAVALKGTDRRKHPSFSRVHEKCPDPPDLNRQIHHFNNGSQPFSPLMRSQYSPQLPPKDRYLSSQGSAGDDLELPDVETLFNQLTGKRKAEHEQQSPSRGTRGKLCIVSDDTDDFDI